MKKDEEFIAATIKHTCISLGFVEFYKYVKFSFTERRVSHFALALCGRGKIVFTKAAWKMATQKEKYELVVHETCHLIAHEIAPNERPAHGKTWKELMRKMGFVPDRYMYINYAPDEEDSLFELRCDCSIHTLTFSELSNIRRVKRICSMCHTNLADCDAERVDF